MKISLTSLSFLFLLTALLLSTPNFVRGQDNPTQPAAPETLTATVVGTSGAASGKSFGISININSYSTEGDASLLLEAVQLGKKNSLLTTLQSMSSKGRIAVTGQVGDDANYIRQISTAKGRTIRILIDRKMSFLELTRGTRSKEYQFSALELFLDEKGNGDGLLYPAAKFKINKDTNQLELEDYGQAPLRITNILGWK
jgi:hypothetical protein